MDKMHAVVTPQLPSLIKLLAASYELGLFLNKAITFHFILFYFRNAFWYWLTCLLFMDDETVQDDKVANYFSFFNLICVMNSSLNSPIHWEDNYRSQNSTLLILTK